MAVSLGRVTRAVVAGLARARVPSGARSRARRIRIPHSPRQHDSAASPPSRGRCAHSRNSSRSALGCVGASGGGIEESRAGRVPFCAPARRRRSRGGPRRGARCGRPSPAASLRASGGPGLAAVVASTPAIRASARTRFDPFVAGVVWARASASRSRGAVVDLGLDQDARGSPRAPGDASRASRRHVRACRRDRGAARTSRPIPRSASRRFVARGAWARCAVGSPSCGRACFLRGARATTYPA